MRVNVLLLCLVPLVLVSSCKKDQQKIMMEEANLAAEASLNLDLNKLRNNLKDAKTNEDRAVIQAKIVNINIEKGNVVESINSSKELVKYQPNQYFSHYLMGKSYLQAGRYREAETELIVSINLKKDFALSHFELGNTYYKMKQYARAETEFKTAINLDNTLYMAHNNLGVIKSLLGENEGAIQSIETAIKLKADFAASYKNLGIIYDLRLKNKALALKNYRKYIEISPNCPDRNLILTWIRVLGG